MYVHVLENTCLINHWTRLGQKVLNTLSQQRDVRTDLLSVLYNLERKVSGSMVFPSLVFSVF